MSEVNLKNLTTENNVLNTREIFRHETDTGSVIKFEQFGETVKLFVPDAKYRSKLIDFRPQAPDYTIVFNNAGPLITSGECLPGPKLGPLTTFFNSTDTDDISLDYKLLQFLRDGSSRENTDRLLSVHSEACARVRKLRLGIEGESFKGYDLPNIYALSVILTEAPRIDELDPTVELYSQDSLTSYVETSSTDYFWSSSVCDELLFYSCSMSCLRPSLRWQKLRVVPVLEI